LSKKHKQHRPTAPSQGEVRQRAQRAAQEGRFQQALDLAKQLYKQEPTPENRAFLKQTYLGRARQLIGQGYTRDAITVLTVARQVDPADPVYLGEVASELARCGALQEVLPLLEHLPEVATGKVFAAVADVSMRQGPAGRGKLPVALQPDFDRIVQAFEQVEKGQDEEAKTTLQGIGLKSPFLEWKVFLRGLQAGYQNDDPRALENWQRLNPERLPARLAAPFRLSIDSDFRAAQPPTTQHALQKQLERLQGASMANVLREVQNAYARQEPMSHAFTLVQGLLPQLRKEAPHLVPRLAACFYWAILETGPEDLRRYERVFGPPAQDPHFARLRALAYERAGEVELAHKSWQDYEKQVSGNKALWGDDTERVRALIWLRMGQNAAGAPDERALERLPDWMRDHPDRPRPLKPSPDECFNRCRQLAPDLLPAYEEPFLYHRRARDAKKTEAAGKRLLEKFPKHVPTLTALGDMVEEQGRATEALDLYLRALQQNPLDRALRTRVGDAHLSVARSDVQQKKLDEARQQCQAARAYLDGRDPTACLCLEVACAFQAREASQAEELLTQARTRGPSSAAVSYQMLVEAASLKLDKKVKSRFDGEFKQVLKQPVTLPDVLALLRAVHRLQQSGVTYHGQKTHTKKIQALAEALDLQSIGDRDFFNLGKALLDADGRVVVDRLLRKRGNYLHSEDPYWHYLSALSEIARGPERMIHWNVRNSLEMAQRYARQMPDGDEKQQLLDGIHQQLEYAERHNPYSRFSGFFGDMFGDESEEFDDDYEDDGW
jgi:tetratricopeptide (TPR) repeat protein